MKSSMKSLMLVWVVLSFVGCGIARDASDTLEQTKQMNNKMDETNKKMDQTNAKIEATNKKMDVTNAAIHTQTLSVALNSMLATENGEVLTPPTDIIPFAEKFDEEATPMEILQTFHLLYTSVLKGFDAEANGDKKLHRRRVRLTAASALAALASPEKVNEIFEMQIEKEGQYMDTAYVFALCRYNFTRDFLLKPVLDPARTPTVKLLEVAFTHYNVMKQLANVRYVDRLKVNIPEFIIKNKETNELAPLEDLLNPVEYKGLGRAAIRKFDDKNNAKMQTPEAQEMINTFR